MLWLCLDGLCVWNENTNSVISNFVAGQSQCHCQPYTGLSCIRCQSFHGLWHRTPVAWGVGLGGLGHGQRQRSRVVLCNVICCMGDKYGVAFEIRQAGSLTNLLAWWHGGMAWQSITWHYNGVAYDCQTYTSQMGPKADLALNKHKRQIYLRLVENAVGVPRQDGRCLRTNVYICRPRSGERDHHHYVGQLLACDQVGSGQVPVHPRLLCMYCLMIVQRSKVPVLRSSSPPACPSI